MGAILRPLWEAWNELLQGVEAKLEEVGRDGLLKRLQDIAQSNHQRHVGDQLVLNEAAKQNTWQGKKELPKSTNNAILNPISDTSDLKLFLRVFWNVRVLLVERADDALENLPLTQVVGDLQQLQQVDDFLNWHQTIVDTRENVIRFLLVRNGIKIEIEFSPTFSMSDGKISDSRVVVRVCNSSCTGCDILPSLTMRNRNE